jgi:hypothetical protein
MTDDWSRIMPNLVTSDPSLLCSSWFNSVSDLFHWVVYYESIKRELQRIPIYECRCDEKLKTKAEGSTRLAYTGLLGGLEHLKIETRLIDERFASVMGECVFLK